MSTIEVKVPDIGDFTDVPVIEVLVKPGDTVKAEDSLVRSGVGQGDDGRAGAGSRRDQIARRQGRRQSQRRPPDPDAGGSGRPPPHRHKLHPAAKARAAGSAGTRTGRARSGSATAPATAAPPTAPAQPVQATAAPSARSTMRPSARRTPRRRFARTRAHWVSTCRRSRAAARPGGSCRKTSRITSSR